MSTEHSIPKVHRASTGTRVRRWSFTALAILIATSTSLTFAADAMSQNAVFDIPAQSVESALHEFSKQADVQVMVASADVAGQRTSGVKGRLIVANALAQLLQDTNLEYGTLGGDTVTIKRVAAAPAETAEAPPAKVRQSRPPESGRESSANKPGRGPLEEVIVTAQKREERLQDVPISITAVSDVMLERMAISDVSGLYGRVPSLYFSSASSEVPRAGTRSSPTIRGITRRQFEPAAGVYIDDIYQPNMAFGEDFLDLERVEVLRGPQGTLFGRNTLAGAIQMVTKKPTNSLSSSVALEAKEFDSFKGKASISGPLIDGKLAARLSAQAETTGGYIRNVTRNDEQLDGNAAIARLALLATPSESLEINFAADYSDSDRGTMFGVTQGCHCYVTDTDLDSRLKTENYGGGLTINWSLPLFKVTSATGYRHIRQISDYDSDGSGLLVGNRQQFEDVDTFLSEELRLTSNGSGPLSWVVGAFAFDSSSRRHRAWDIHDTTSTPEAADAFGIFEGTVVRYQNNVDRSGGALFAHADYSLLDDRLKLSAGGRYSRETASSAHDQYIVVPLISPLPILTFTFASDDEHFSDFTPSGSISYRWTDNLTTYVTVSEGFLAGGFQRAPDDPVTAGTPFNNEHSTNYEVGAKGSLFDRRMSFGLSLYRIDMKDLQVGVIRMIDGLPIGVVDNAARGESRGVELETAIRLTDNLTFGGSVSYTDAKFTDYIDDAGNDRSGDKFENVPKWLGAADLEYVYNWTNDLDITFLGSYRYVADVTLGTGGFTNPFRERQPFDIVDASVSLSKDSWKVSLFVENLLDEYQIAYSSTGAFNPEIYEEPLPPRTAGIRFSREW